LRNILWVAIGATVYYGLLGFVYSKAPYTSMPQWWGAYGISKPFAVVSWFTLLNVAGAVLSSMPVAIALVFAGKARPLGRAAVVGLLAALAIAAGGLSEYGLPDSGGAWLADIAQFLGICGAVVASVALVGRLPSNTSLERTRDR
jgi:hypothetical protein